MKNRILKWWNREWSDWKHYSFEGKEIFGNTVSRYEVLFKTSNDGLVKYKKIKIISV